VEKLLGLRQRIADRTRLRVRRAQFIRIFLRHLISEMSARLHEDNEPQVDDNQVAAM
jgi:hypothetical protein